MVFASCRQRPAGRLAHQIPDSLRTALQGLRTDAQRALQFARSAPGSCLRAGGHEDARDVDENAALAQVAPLPALAGR